MYTPPQECLEELLGPQEVPSTFLFSPTGLGAKERRERWIWKDQAASKALRESHPFSYTYVIEDGRLATIAESRPDTRQSKTSHQPTQDRHSSPVLACGFPLMSSPPTEPKRVVKRSLSLTFSTQSRDELPMYRSTTVADMNKRALPALPTNTAPSSPPSTTSEFPQRIHYRRPAQLNFGKAPPSPPPTFQLPPTPRRSFEEPRPAPLPPRRSPSQRQGAALTPPPSPPAISREFSVKSLKPQKLRRKTSKFIELVEDRLRPIVPARISPSKASPLSPPPPFEEEQIPPMPMLPRDLILPPSSPSSVHVSFVAPQSQQRLKPHDLPRIDSAIGSHRSAHSSAQNSARSSLHRDLEQHASIEMCNLIGSKATASILESRGLVVSPTHATAPTKLQKRALKKQMSLPRIIVAPYSRSATPAEDYMMSGGLAPTRSTSISTTASFQSSHPSSAVSHASSRSSVEEVEIVPIRYQLNTCDERTFLPLNVPRRSFSTACDRPISTATSRLSNFVCDTAEIKPIALKSPVVAMGNARLISC